VSDIYGQLTEHPEVPIEDPRHFTITIKLHDFEEDRKRRFHGARDPFCARCGYHKDTAVHTKESA
jgi:hypothetical protein